MNELIPSIIIFAVILTVLWQLLGIKQIDHDISEQSRSGPRGPSASGGSSNDQTALARLRQLEQSRSGPRGPSASGGSSNDQTALSGLRQPQKIKVLDEKTFGEILWMASGSAYCGGFTPGKGLIIKNWVQREIKKFDESKSLSLKSISNNIMTLPPRTLMTFRIPKDSWSFINYSNNIRLDAYALIVSIMAEDKKLSNQEMMYLNKAENFIGLQYEIYKEVKDKFFFGLVVTSDLSDRDILTLLNVIPSWTKREKLQYLTTEFTLWNSRSQGGPPSRRRAAIQRLALIGRARVLVQGE